MAASPSFIKFHTGHTLPVRGNVQLLQPFGYLICTSLKTCQCLEWLSSAHSHMIDLYYSHIFDVDVPFSLMNLSTFRVIGVCTSKRRVRSIEEYFHRAIRIILTHERKRRPTLIVDCSNPAWVCNRLVYYYYTMYINDFRLGLEQIIQVDLPISAKQCELLLRLQKPWNSILTYLFVQDQQRLEFARKEHRLLLRYRGRKTLHPIHIIPSFHSRVYYS